MVSKSGRFQKKATPGDAEPDAETSIEGLEDGRLGKLQDRLVPPPSGGGRSLGRCFPLRQAQCVCSRRSAHSTGLGGKLLGGFFLDLARRNLHDMDGVADDVGLALARPRTRGTPKGTPSGCKQVQAAAA